MATVVRRFLKFENFLMSLMLTGYATLVTCMHTLLGFFKERNRTVSHESTGKGCFFYHYGKTFHDGGNIFLFKS